MVKLGIFGSSGQARELLDIAKERYDEIFFIDLTESIEKLTGIKVILENDIEKCKIDDFIIGIGQGDLREKIYRKYENLNFVNLIHPSSIIGTSVKKNLNESKGNIFCAGTILTENIKIGNFNLFNIGVTVSHDCIIGDFVTISPGANVAGNVSISSKVFIGIGATILPGRGLEDKLTINEGSIVGAGAVVVKDVEANKVVKGIPAK